MSYRGEPTIAFERGPVATREGKTNDGYVFEIFSLSSSTWGWTVTDSLDGLPIAAGTRRSYREACVAVQAAIGLDRKEMLPT